MMDGWNENANAIHSFMTTIVVRIVLLFCSLSFFHPRDHLPGHILPLTAWLTYRTNRQREAIISVTASLARQFPDNQVTADIRSGFRAITRDGAAACAGAPRHAGGQ